MRYFIKQEKSASGWINDRFSVMYASGNGVRLIFKLPFKIRVNWFVIRIKMLDKDSAGSIGKWRIPRKMWFSLRR